MRLVEKESVFKRKKKQTTNSPENNDNRSNRDPERKLSPGWRKFRAIMSKNIFVIAIFWYELVFKFSTTINPVGFNMLYILLYSVVLGLVCWFLGSLSRKPEVNRRIKRIVLIVIPVLYCIEFFVYRQFKVFYDINTCLNGAGGVISDYMEETLKLIFCWDGLSHIFLFFLPLILYCVFGKKIDPAKSPRHGERLLVLIQLVLIFVVNVLLINVVPVYSATYGKEYNFQNAVDAFGLSASLRLDIRNNLFYKDDINFNGDTDLETATIAPTATVEPTEPTTGETTTDEGDTVPTPEPTETPIEYNELDIDFEALAESTSSDTAKTLDEYVATLTPSQKNDYTGMFEGKNLIMICAEAFSGDIIDEDLTPTLYRLATKGINFNDYTVSATAGTTGGEYGLIFGMLPTDGGSSMTDTVSHNNYYTMGSQLNRLGYWGKMYHNNSYTYYNRDETHFNLGYSEGFEAVGNGAEEYISGGWPQSDLEMMEGTIPQYIDQEHFNVYYMTVSGHSAYSFSSNTQSRKNEDAVADLDYSEDVKAYIAAQLELENALTYLVDQLEEKGIADDTVIVLTADHFPYGLDGDASLGNMPYLEELYGCDVDNYLVRDHNRLIIWSGCLEDEDPIVVDDPCSNVDILPTLSNLFGLEYDSRLMPGRDVFSENTDPLVWTLFYDWKTDLGTYIASTGTFTPVSDDVEIPEGYVDTIKKIVQNKIAYCKGCLSIDYFGHVFGDEE